MLHRVCKKVISSYFQNMAVIGIALMIVVFLIAACCGSLFENDRSKTQNQPFPKSPFPTRHRNEGGRSDRDDDDD